MATGHLDRNGLLDMAILTRETGHLDILLNQGCGGSSHFRRGDANSDFILNLTDAVHMMQGFSSEG